MFRKLKKLLGFSEKSNSNQAKTIPKSNTEPDNSESAATVQLINQSTDDGLSLNAEMPPVLMYHNVNTHIRMRRTTDSVQPIMSAEVVDTILTDIVDSVGIRRGFGNEARKYTKYGITRDKQITTYVISSPMVGNFLASTPLTYCAIKTKYDTIYPVACILSYFWWVNSSGKDLTDFNVVLNAYARSYMDTLNAIQVYYPNLHYEQDSASIISYIRRNIDNIGMSEVPYIDKFLSAYEKSVSVYVKTRISKYNYILAVVANELERNGMTMEDLFRYCIMVSISQDMPDEVIINSDSILKLLGECIAIAFTAVL